MSHLARGPSVLGIDSKANAAGGRRMNAGSRQLTSAEAALHEIPPFYAYCYLARGPGSLGIDSKANGARGRHYGIWSRRLSCVGRLARCPEAR